MDNHLKPLAFEIDFKENAPSPKKLKTKERLEQRKKMLENSDEKQKLEAVIEKIEKAS